MPKILEYTALTDIANDDLLFIGDYSNTNSNPTIHRVTTNSLFTRDNIKAKGSSGLSFYDCNSSLSLFLKEGGNVGVGGSTANYTLQVNGDFYVSGGIFDCNGASGSADQFLKSVGSCNYVWADISSIGGGTISGSGTANAIPKWSSSSALTDSVQNEVNSKIGIGLGSPAVEPSAKLEILDSSTLLQLTNGTSGSATTFVNFCGANSYNVYMSRSNASLFSIGQYSTPNDGNINLDRSTGYLAIGTTEVDYPLTVCTSNTTTSRFSSSNTSGSQIFLTSTSASDSNCNAYNSVIAYSNYESSAQKVNWLTGTFMDDSSNKYFGITYKDNTNLSSCNAVLDNSTVTNNLFYIKNATISSTASAEAYLANSIHTHNKTNAGHNTGRFVCIEHIPFAASLKVDGANKWFTFYPGLGKSNNYYVEAAESNTSENGVCCNIYTVNGDGTIVDLPDQEIRRSVWSRAPYDGKLICAHVDAEGSYNGSGAPGADDRKFNIGFWSTLNQDVCYVSNALVTFTDTNFCWKSGGSDFSSVTDSNLTFSAGDYLSVGLGAACGNYVGILRLTYEFKIT